MINREAAIKRAVEIEDMEFSSKNNEEILTLSTALVAGYDRVLNKNFMLDVGAGWWKIMLEGFDRIDAVLKEEPDCFVKILQVKEKFGGLRVYISLQRGSGDGLDGEEHEDLHRRVGVVIEEMENQASNTCEMCGEPGKLRGGGWLKTLCDRHAEMREAKKYGN